MIELINLVKEYVTELEAFSISVGSWWPCDRITVRDPLIAINIASGYTD